MQKQDSHYRQVNRVIWESLASNEGAPVSSRSVRYKRRARNGKLAALTAFLALVLVGGTTFYFAGEAYAASTARAAYFHESARYEKLVAQFETAKADASLLLTNCSASVTDTDLCIQLNSTLDEAEKVDASGCEHIDPYNVETEIIEAQSQCLSEKNTLIEQNCDDLEEKMRPVHEAVIAKGQ